MPRDIPKANPRAQLESLRLEYPEAFRFSRGGTFFRYHPRPPQSVRLWFPRGARISPKGPLWKNLGKPEVRSVHSKFQIALIENQSLVKLSHLWDWQTRTARDPSQLFKHNIKFASLQSADARCALPGQDTLMDLR